MIGKLNKVEYSFESDDFSEDGVYERRYSINGDLSSKLTLRPGKGEFIIMQDSIPFKITHGLNDLRENISYMLKDRRFHELNAESVLVQELHGMSLQINTGMAPHPELATRYLAALQYLEIEPEQWEAYTQKKRAKIIIDVLVSLRADMQKVTAIQITGSGIESLSDILHDEEPIFKLEEPIYTTHSPYSFKFHQEFELFNTLILKH